MPTLPNITPEIIKAYQDSLVGTSSPSTAKRKTVSLNQFFGWAKESGKIENNPLAKPATVRSDATITNPYTVTTVKKTNKKTWATIGITTALIILIFLLTFKLKFPIPFTLNFAQEASIQTNQQTNQNGLSQNKVASPAGSLNTANNAVIGAWNLYTKLILTDTSGHPIVGAQSLGFKVYNSETGGSALYTSPTQNVSTDTNGSVLISLKDVPTDLFFQNNKLFLEPSIGSISGTLRIPVSTASTPSNLNGYLPADPSLGASNETVPVIDSTGTLSLASQSPAVVAKQGNFLIQGQAVTIKTADGGDGNIEINPDGKGIAHFLFEGSKGNFLNAQGPNLTSGSLYYGMVPNNATGYDLIRLQSGSPKMTTKFSVDALGNTYIAGDLNVINDIATNGVDRLSSAGLLKNITGYSQNSGNFTVNQNVGDFASITKKGSALSDVLNLTLDERGYPNSSYSTLTLNRFNGAPEAAALHVDEGNAIFDGQVQLGRFGTNPDSIGQGSLVYNTTDQLVYFWNGSAWVAMGTGASTTFTNITSGTNTIANMVIGSGATLSTSGTGTIAATDLVCSGCVANSELANSAITFAGDSGSSAISLGGTETINGSNGITTTQSGSTLTVAGVNATTSTVGVASFDSNFFTVTSGAVTIANDSLDFAQFKDAMTLDAATSIATAGFALSTSGTGALNFASTGQVTLAGNVDATNGLDVTGANLTVATNTLLNGDTTIGNATTDGITFTGRANSSLLPITSNTYDLGSALLQWNNIFGANLYQGGNAVCDSSGANCPVTGASLYWNQAVGALFPTNSSVDVLIGSSATTSAKFAFTGVNSGTPTASISGATANVATYLTGEGTLATTNMAPLNIGTSTTGGITIGTNSQTVNLNSNDWDISTVGNLSGIGTIASDGDWTNTQSTPSIFLVDSTPSEDDYSIDINGSVFGISNSTDTRTEISFDGTGGISIGNNTATKTINIGGVTVSAADTINIATEATAADVVTIGNANASTTLGLTGGTTWSVSTAGLITTINDIAINGGDITTTATTFNLLAGATTTLNIGPTGAAGSMTFSGGSADTGCTLDGTNGNLTCTGNITGSSSGTVGFWTRTGTILTPATANDVVAISSNDATNPVLALTSTGATPNAVTLTGNSITTGNLANLTATGLTTGNLLALNTDTNRTGFAFSNSDTSIAGQKDQTQIANITNTFVYDTNQDSDGGLWKNDERAKSSSWYNEASGSTRGTRREFPDKAIVTATTTNLYIYDAKDNSLWMEFDKGATTTEQMIGPTTNSTGSSVFALNGKIYYGNNGSVGQLYVIDLKNDGAYRYNATDDYYGNKTIANRNSTVTWSTGASSPITNTIVEDVHGINYNGKSYVAVATNTGMSVINETDKVVYSYSDVTSDVYKATYLDKIGDLYGLNSTSKQLERWNSVISDSASELNGTPDNVWDETGVKIAGAAAVAGPYLFSTAQTINTAPDALFVTTGTSDIDGKSDTIYVGSATSDSVGDLTAINDKKGDEGNGSAKYYTKSNISEGMIGDIRAMWPMTESSGAITDISAKANVLATKGTVTYSVSGVRGTGVTTNGTTGHFCSDANADTTCDNDSDYDFGTGSFSVSSWFNHSVTAPSTTETLIDHTYNTTPALVLGWRVWMDSTGKIVFGIDDDSTFTSNVPTDDQATSTNSYNDGLWHHVVAVKDSTNAIYLYIDGQLAGSDVSLTATGTLTGTAVILGVGSDCSAGAACATGARFWNGSIDELTINAETETISQIKRQYQIGQRALLNHTASRITGVTGGDSYQRLMGTASGGTTTSSRVMAVGVDAGNQFVFAGVNDSSGNTGGVTIIGVDSDSAVDLYDGTANTTKKTDANAQFSANDTISLSVHGFPCIGYNTGTTACDKKATMSIAGIDGSNNNQNWMETTNTSLYSTLATLTSPGLTKNDATINNIFRVFNTYNNITQSTTGETIETAAFSVDSSGLVVYNYLNPATGNTAMTLTDNILTTGTTLSLTSSALTTGTGLKLVSGGALTTGSALSVTSGTYIHTTAETGNLANLTFSDASTNTSGNSITNGLNIAPTVNTTGAGTKAVNGVNVVAPTITACTSGACTLDGIKINTITSGAVAAITSNGLDIQATGISAGTLIGANISNITGSTGTETAVKIGSGWDTDLSFVDTTPVIASGNGFTLNFTDGTNNLIQMIDKGTIARFLVSDSLQVATGASLAEQAYSVFGTAAVTHTGNITTADDLLISGDVELDGNLYLDGKNIFNTNGNAAITLCSGGSGAACATTSAQQNTLSTGAWVIDNQVNVGEPSLAVNNAKSGDLIVASASGTLKFKVANNGDVTLGDNSGTDLTVGGGTGKVDAGTIDPPYTINGKKFATFLSGIVGVKEEVVGQATTSEYVPGIGYRYLVDFNSLPEGSDLWLFSKATDIKTNITKLVALLTPSDPTRVWYEVDKENKRLAIYSARPTTISYRLTGPRFDHQNWSNERSADGVTGFILNIPDMVNNSPVVANLQRMSDFVITKIQDGYYQVKDSGGNVVDGVESIGNFVAGNIKSGAITTSELATNSFTTLQGTVDNLLVASGLVTPNAKIALISPLPNMTDITVKIGGDSTDSGKLAIQNNTGTEVALIDTKGNAKFAGDVHSNNIDEIQSILNQVSTNQDFLTQIVNSNINTATNSASLSQLATTDLYVTGQAAVNSLSVTTNLAIGSDLVLNSSDSSLNTLSSPLRIQSLALAPVEIMAGKVKISTNGDMQIDGNLFIAGKIKSHGLEIKDASENNVATINTAGDGEFNSLSTSLVVIAGAQTSTPSAAVNGQINSNSTVGQAIIPANTTEVTILNPKVTDYTLVYVTPTSSSENKVLYIKSKGNGYFTLGFSEALPTDVSFNWWIVATSQ